MEEKQYKDIELRSEEVQEVMNKVPPRNLTLWHRNIGYHCICSVDW